MNKQILRNKYKEIRKNIKNKEELDKIIFNKVINLEEYKQSDLILALIKYSLKNSKKVAVPKCEGNDIIFYYINSLEDLEEGKFRILEPKTNQKVTNLTNSICIVPGVAFDKQNNRIGYGRGFYDRFLENFSGIRIGLTYKECICEKIYVDENDIKMDKVIF